MKKKGIVGGEMMKWILWIIFFILALMAVWFFVRNLTG